MNILRLASPNMNMFYNRSTMTDTVKLTLVQYY